MDFLKYIEKISQEKLTKSQKAYLNRMEKEIGHECEIFMVPKIGYSLAKDFSLNFNRR